MSLLAITITLTKKTAATTTTTAEETKTPILCILIKIYCPIGAIRDTHRR